MAVRLYGHLVQHGTSIPVGVGEKVLERLVVAIGHDFLHALHVFCAVPASDPAGTAKPGGHRARPTPEVLLEALGEFLKSEAHPSSGDGHW